jgi:DNA-binding winged helix-turn-helix (wHTH) protein
MSWLEVATECQANIVRDGQAIHLPSKSAEVLLWLARHPRHLVGRQELLAKVWGDGSREALRHAIGEIRHALTFGCLRRAI